MKRRFLDADADMPQPARCGRIGEKVLRENSVNIEDRVTVEANLLCLVHKECDRVLVVDDHLRFEAVAALRFFAEFDQPLRIEQGVRVSLKAA